MTRWTFPRSKPGQLELHCEDFQASGNSPEDSPTISPLAMAKNIKVELELETSALNSGR